MNDDNLCTMILAAAFRVHSRLGPGLLESVYQRVLTYELTKGGLSTEVQKSIPIVYDDLVFEEGYRADLVVESRVLLELKSVETQNPPCLRGLRASLSSPGRQYPLLMGQ